jgi:predicted MFS family arabinose efflux permease
MRMMGGRTFELWFVGMFVQGVIFLGFIPILVPLIVLEIFGNPETVGLFISVLGFSALSSILWGILASRWNVGSVHLLGLMQLALGGFLMAFAGERLWLWMLGALFIGLGSAANLAMSFTLIGGAGLPPDQESAKISGLQRMLPSGQMTGLILVAALLFVFPETTELETVSFSLMGAIGIMGMVVVMLFGKGAVKRFSKASISPEERVDGKTGYRKRLFWAYMLAIFLSMVPIAMFESQLPNIMLDVWTIEPDTTALVLAIGVALTILAYSAVGRMQAVRGPLTVWWGSMATRLIAYLCLFALTLISAVQGSVFPLIVYWGMLFSLVFSDVSTPILTARLATMPQSSAQNMQTASMALAFAFSPLLAGFAASNMGYASITWISAAMMVIAIVTTSYMEILVRRR